jgi:two-component system sensor histidine kinase YesM
MTILLLFLIGFFTSIVFALLISKGLSSSVLSLKKTVQAVYQGDLHARFKAVGQDEVSYLGERFNEMLDEINLFFIKQKEQESSNKTLELKLMQSQINPHLLYNTLDSILWALDNKDTSRAKNLIVSLSSFFKITLSGGNDLIPLQKELELVSNYIYIQNLARSKNIKLSIKAPEDLLHSSIIKLSIQPIVENAILHGFPGFRDDGTIAITVHCPVPGSLEIVIEDNGIGIPEQELLKINEILDSYPLDTEIKHFGLYNVQRRIKNLFGNEYGIRLGSEVGHFTRIIMRLPLNSKTKKEDIHNV